MTFSSLLPALLGGSLIRKRRAVGVRLSAVGGVESCEARCLLSAHALQGAISAHGKEKPPKEDNTPNFAGNWYIYKNDVQYSSIVFQQTGKDVSSETNNAFSYTMSGKVKGETLTLKGEYEGEGGAKIKVIWKASFTNPQHFTGTYSEGSGKHKVEGKLDGDISII